MHQTSDRTLVVVNMAAARAARVWPFVRETLARNGVPFDAHESRAPGDTEAQTRAALREGYGTIAVVGGDGTLSEAARGFFEPPAMTKERVSATKKDLSAPKEEETASKEEETATKEGHATQKEEHAPREAGEASEEEEPAPPRSINPEASLALLPAGTGDDLARGLAGRRAPLTEWLFRLVNHCSVNSGEQTPAPSPAPGRAGDETYERAAEDAEARASEGATVSQWERTTRRIDAFSVTVDGGARSFVCLNAATLGVGAEVATRVAAQRGTLRRMGGEARFAVAALSALAAWRNREVRVSVDDEWLMECATNLIVVANGPFAGGGMNFAPSARLDDGRLEVLAACRFSRAGVVRELARVHRGGHLANPKVVLTSGMRVRVETTDRQAPLAIEADGDARGHTPAEFRIMPGALRVVW